MESLRFHEATKHTPTSVRSSGGLDWSIKPHPFKDYLELPAIPLPRPAPDTAFSATAAAAGRLGTARPLDVAEVARLATLAAANVTKTVAGETTSYFRTYASAGALYPIEAYLACAGVDGLEDGLYHFHPLERALRPLREADPRPYLVRATGGEEAAARAPLAVVLSGIPWRTAWKYGPRGYRHLWWDSGMILANLLAVCASGGHAARVVLGFADPEVNALLGIDGRSEMALAVVPIGFGSPAPAARAAEDRAAPITHPFRPLSERERDHPEVVQVHEASQLRTPEDAAQWRAQSGVPDRSRQAGGGGDGIEAVIRRRGSTRKFSRAPISERHLKGVLAAGLSPLDCDWGPPLVGAAVIANDVEGVASGAYRWAEDQLAPITPGDFRETAQFLCLEQQLAGDSAATCFLLADLEQSVARLGDRGYRAAQLEAGIAAGRMYLATCAERLGATGLTFYDDEIRKFFGTDAEPMLVVAIGRPAQRASRPQTRA